VAKEDAMDNTKAWLKMIANPGVLFLTVFWGGVATIMIRKGWLWPLVKGVAATLGILSVLYLGATIGKYLHRRMKDATTHTQDTDSDSSAHLSAVPDDGNIGGSGQ